MAQGGKILVEFLGVFREIAKCSQFEIDGLRSTSLHRVIDLLATRFGERMREQIVDPDGKIRGSVGLILNNRVLDIDAISDIQVQEGDILVFLHAISGG